MFQYESKKSAALGKTFSANKNKNIGSRRISRFYPSVRQNNIQAFNHITQTSSCPAVMPQAEERYSADGAGASYDVLSDSSNDVDLILDMLPKNCQRNSLNELLNDPNIMRIFENWETFFPRFLERCGFRGYGARPSLTFHRPKSNNSAELSERSVREKITKINELYKKGSGIQMRRKYTDEEEMKRYLRHCAAALKVIFETENEIQCYYNDENNTVYVSANTKDDEKKLSEIDGEMILKYSIIFRHSFREINKNKYNKGNSSVLRKFNDKIVDAILSGDGNKPHLKRFTHTLTCPTALKKAKFKLIKSSDIDVQINGLHAERKILYYLRKKNNRNMYLDPLRLGGIRRPCFICSALCFEDMFQIHSGPVWCSKAASAPKDIKEMFLILDAVRNSENTTHITYDNGRFKMDADTESDE